MFTIAETRCPSGHLILQAIHREGQEAALAYVQTKTCELLRERILAPYCSRCAARANQWTYEARIMPFEDITPIMASFRNLRTDQQMAGMISTGAGWAAPLRGANN